MIFLSIHANFQLKFVRMQVNRVADNLTEAYILENSTHVFNYIPSCIFHFIVEEMTYSIFCLKKIS